MIAGLIVVPAFGVSFTLGPHADAAIPIAAARTHASACGPREDSESAPAAGIDDRRSAAASGGGAPRAVNNVLIAQSSTG